MAYKKRLRNRGMWQIAVLGLLCCLLAACDMGPANPSTATVPGKDGNWGHQTWHLHLDTLDIRIETGRLLGIGNRGQETISFQDSLVVRATNLHGTPLATLKAHEATSLPPYDLVAARDFLWICGDGVEIEGSDLFWHVHDPEPITIEGDLQIINDKGMVMGQGLTGDLLLQRYEVASVLSVVLWDDVAGGREGHLSGQ